MRKWLKNVYIKIRFFLDNYFNIHGTHEDPTFRFGSFFFTRNEQGWILLVKHNYHHPVYGYGNWSFPGGGLKLGETVIEGAERENKEETGYPAEATALIALLPTKKQGRGQLAFTIGSITGPQGDFNHEEIAEVKFFCPDSPPLNMYPAQKALWQIGTNYRFGDPTIYHWPS